jgi:hypothetical protein
MPTISIQIQGVQELIKRLGDATAAATLRPPLERSMERLRVLLATYPPQPTTSTYARTGNLGRGWKTSLGSGSLQASLTNRVPYGPFVQGDKTQAGMHRGRWITDQQAVTKETPAIEADFQDAIAQALQ